MKKQALLLVAEDDPDDQYFFRRPSKWHVPGRLKPTMFSMVPN